jgi:methyl-accepting chemotaxis protein
MNNKSANFMGVNVVFSVVNLRVGARLGLGFGVVLLLLIVVTGMGVTRLGHVNDATTQITKDRLPKVVGVFEIDSAINEIGKSAYGLALAPDTAFADKQKAEIAGARKVIAANLESLVKTIRSAKGKEILQAMTTAQSAFFAGIDDMLKLHAEGRKQEAVTNIMTRMRDARHTFMASTDAMLKFQNDAIDTGAKDADDTYRTGMNLMVGLAVIAVLLAIGIAWWVTRSVTVPIREAVAMAEKVAAGDLTSRIEVTSSDETGQLLQALKNMNESLQKIVGEVRTGSEAIASGTRQIASGNQDLSQRTEEQASSLEETASSMEELTSTVKQNAENAKQANQLAIGASEVAGKGGAVVQEVVSTMSSINESSRKIVEIISVIDSIAFQTNILALNAAVEAARAGEQGRGFAVVATEVRNLAQRSAAAAKEIKALIGDSVEKVDTGTRLVDAAGKTMEEIVVAVKRVTDIMGEITAASQEQSSGIEQVNQAVTQMDEVTQQNASLVEEAAAAAESLQEQAQTLEAAVAVFRLASAEARPAARSAEVVHLAATRPARKPEAGKALAAGPAKRRAEQALRAKTAAAGGGEGKWEEF